LKLILENLGEWHADAKLYEKQAWGPNKSLPGFAKSLDDEGKPKGLFEHDGTGASPGFKGVLFTWHKALNSALRDCLDGTEWMHIRNAITIVKSVADVFPAVDFMGKGFIKQLETIAKREKDVREDLSLTGNAVLVQLKKKSSNWVMVQAFSSTMVCLLVEIDRIFTK
jgi:THO complex subunit 2